MRPFRATYRRQVYIAGRPVNTDGPPETVLVVAVQIPDREMAPLAIFIDQRNRLKSDTIDRLSDCYSIDWMAVGHE